jgi:prepilin-type N-terminal cleavage/methylation domain-containing protein
MTTVRHRRQTAAAFTLVELLVAIAILSVLMVFIGLMMTAASKATQLSRERLDADRQARLIFDSMADDFTRMMRRPDVDFHFVKQAGNDCFFMFCENPGYFSTTLTAATESNVSLIGYRINTLNNPPVGDPTKPTDIPYTLEKLAKGLSWDSQASTTPPTYPVVFLTLDQATGTTPTFAPDSSSTIVGRWPNIDQTTYTDTSFHLLGDSTFRLEFCFLLTDGSYSLVPALSYSFTPPSGATISSNLTATAAPTPSNGYPTYGVGSRWYDTKDFQGYICTSAPQTPSNTAVWQPLGMADVQAVIVAIAILDQNSQKIIAGNSTALQTLAAALPDPTAANLSATPPQLMATTWLNTVNSPTFASSVGLPGTAVSQVRIYQRFFYLNNLYNNL